MVNVVTTRKSILLILSLTVLALTLPVGWQLVKDSGTSDATVFVSPSQIEMRINQTFQASINVSGVVDLYGWEFKLGYNTSLLELVDIAEGSFLNSSRDTYFVPKVMSTDGYVLAGCTSLRNVTGVDGNGTLVTVEFRAKKLGSCTLDLYDTRIVNSAKQLIEHTETDGTVTASGCVIMKVQYKDGHPRSGADVLIRIPSMYLGATNETGQAEVDFLNPGDYTIFAVYELAQFGPDTYLGVDENGDGSSTITADWEITPPVIDVLSPRNQTYLGRNIPLTYTVYDYSPISWVGYSLDSQSNITITGNTIVSVDDGTHWIVVYANDTSGNMGSSQMVCFTVNSSLYEPWETSFIGLGGYPMVGFTAYDGRLYGTSNNNLYIYDGASWNVLEVPTYITSLMPYENKLIIGGQGGLYFYNGSSFSLVFPVSTYIKVLGVYNNTLYAGTFLDKPPALYYCNGSPDNPNNWHVDSGFSTILNFSGPFGSIDSFAAYGNAMFVSSGGTLYSYNGTEWNIVKTYDDVYAFCDMTVYNDKLYLATRDQAWRKPYYQGYLGFNGRVIEFDGNNWTTILDHDYWIYSLEIYDNKLYAGTANKIMVYNGTNWNTSFNALDGAYYAISLTVFDGKIYAGMGNGCIFADPVSEITSPPELPPSMTVPEFPSTMFLPLFAALSLTAVVFVRRRYRRKLKT